MMYYSTNNKAHRVNAREAVMAGLAPDGGLYMPESIPRLSEAFFSELADKSFQEISFIIASIFLGEVSSKTLYEIVTEALNFDIPLTPLSSSFDHQPPTAVLELFHGPTLAFKDVGARFMARLMGYFVGASQEELTILVATSGDTGSAVASGFYNVPGINVVILYPSAKVSKLQEAQMTTLGGNVTALEVDGVFDDCQRLVKQVVVDAELTNELSISCANSINIARLIPQMFYYFWAVAQWKGQKEMTISVPSGNFGNLTAGLMAKRMGLPIERFIAATNMNDIVPEYLETATFHPRPSITTISSAMDVGDPSNFVRMVELYPSVEQMRKDVTGIRVTEKQTRDAMSSVYRQTGYIMDPHGAVAYRALSRLSSGGIFFQTAHPAKFKEVVEKEIGQTVKIPERLAKCLSKQKSSIKIPASFEALKAFLLS
jgi:threonine synthase